MQEEVEEEVEVTATDRWENEIGEEGREGKEENERLGGKGLQQGDGVVVNERHTTLPPLLPNSPPLKKKRFMFRSES